MVALPSRHRSLFLLTGVVLLQILLLAVQINGSAIRRDRLIRVWTVSAVSPVERSGAWGIGKVSRRLAPLFRTERHRAPERRTTAAKTASSNWKFMQLQSKSAEADRLASPAEFQADAQPRFPWSSRASSDSAPTPAARSALSIRALNKGIRKNMGVITPEGVVGKVIESYRDTCQVLLLTDHDGGVGAMIAGSRIQSPVGGIGEPLLNMKYVGNDDDVKVGDRVVTSGMDRIFPKDLPGRYHQSGQTRHAVQTDSRAAFRQS